MGGGRSQAAGGAGGGFKQIGGTINNAIDHFKKDGSLDAWNKAVTNKEKEAIIIYTGGAYSSINRRLREGKAPTDADKLRDAAIAKFELKEGITVTRGSSADMLAPLNLHGSPAQMAAQIKNKHVGGTLRDKAYLSSSTRDKGFDSDVDYLIRVRPGKGKGAFIGHVSNYRSESEFLLARNSELQITGAHVKDGKLVVELLV